MKRIAAGLISFLAAGMFLQASAQVGDRHGSPDLKELPLPPNEPEFRPPVWTNTQPRYWTNTPPPTWTNNFTRPPLPPTWTNTPPLAGTNFPFRIMPPAPGPLQPPPRLEPMPKLPADVQALIKRFEQNRDALANQLKHASEEQRRQILQQLDQLRTQMRDHMAKMRHQAREQAEQMKDRFGNPRDRLLNQGVAPPPTDHGAGGRPR